MEENVSCLKHGALLLESIWSHLWVALRGCFVDLFSRWDNVNGRFVGCTQKFSVTSKLLMHLALWALLAPEELLWYLYALPYQ